MPKVITQKTFRRFFYACMVLTYFVPVILESTGLGNQLNHAADCFRIVPGLDAMASQSRFQNATAIGLGISAILGIVTGVMTIFIDNDRKATSAFLDQFSMSQKVLFSLFSVIFSVLPFVIPSKGGPHQFSYGFFQLVANNPLVFGVFASFLYGYITMTLLFVFAIIYHKKESK